MSEDIIPGRVWGENRRVLGDWFAEKYGIFSRLGDGRTFPVGCALMGGLKKVGLSENDANNETELYARLMAAAPELLEACEDAISRFGPRTPAGRRLREAVQKATGKKVQL